MCLCGLCVCVCVVCVLCVCVCVCVSYRRMLGKIKNRGIKDWAKKPAKSVLCTRNTSSFHYGVSNAWEFIVRLRGRI